MTVPVMTARVTARSMADVLPPNATDVERSLAAQVESLLALDADRIRALWDPWRCDVADLPYLAWALGVDLWDPDWNETKKRGVVARSIALHRVKGTEEGIARHLDVMGSRLVRAAVPPARAFATGAYTEADRLAWLRNLPQIRLYPFRTTRTAPKARAFAALPDRAYRGFFRGGAGQGASFMQATAGPALYGRQATFFDGGVEVPASYEVLADPGSDRPPERVSIVSTGAKRAFAAKNGSAHYGAAFMEASTAAANLVTVRVDPAAAQLFAVFSGDAVVDVAPVRTYEARTAPRAKGFLGAAARQRFLTASDGPRLVYDRISILDPDVLIPRKKVKYFHGHARFGIAPFTAELLVEVPMRRPRSRLGTFCTGFMKRSPMKPLSDALEAIHVARSLRDTVLVNTEVRRVVELGDALPLGTFTLGQTLVLG